jgi:hypothetical protein
MALFHRAALFAATKLFLNGKMPQGSPALFFCVVQESWLSRSNLLLFFGEQQRHL